MTLSAAQKGERTFARAFLAWTVTLFVLTITLEILVNPWADFSLPFYLVKPLNYSYRVEKLQILKKLGQKSPEVFILGSSTVMRMNPLTVERLTASRTFNFGVLDAMPEDYYMITRHVIDDLEIKPAAIILGLDPLSFRGDDSRVVRYADDVYDFFSLPDLLQYLDVQDRPDQWEIMWKKLRATIDKKYLSDTVASIFITVSGKKYVHFFELDENGFAKYSQADFKISRGVFNFESELRQQARLWRNRYSQMRDLSPVRKRYFEKFLKLCQENNIRLFVFITPMQDGLQEILERSRTYGPASAMVRGYLQDMKEKYGFRLFDFTDVESFGGQDIDFYDGVHFGYKNSDLILKKILEWTR
jgi:hypothetical protein